MAGGQHADLAGPRDDGLQFADRGRAVEVRRREGDIARPVLIRPSHEIQLHVRHPTGSPMFPPRPPAVPPVAAATGALAAGAFAVMTSASASPNHAADSRGMMGVHAAGGPVAYSFRTVDDAADLTFNQLLGINNDGVIAGYFGSGAQGHPNMGYLLTPGGYRSENFPGSVQTQVTGLNDNGVTVGFASGMNIANMANNNFGFYATGGQGFHSVNFPTT